MQQRQFRLYSLFSYGQTSDQLKYSGEIMNTIVYGSQYGTARTYPQKLAAKTGFDLLNYEDVKDLKDCQTLIYIGALYAGGAGDQENFF